MLARSGTKIPWENAAWQGSRPRGMLEEEAWREEQGRKPLRKVQGHGHWQRKGYTAA